MRWGGVGGGAEGAHRHSSPRQQPRSIAGCSDRSRERGRVCAPILPRTPTPQLQPCRCSSTSPAAGTGSFCLFSAACGELWFL